MKYNIQISVFKYQCHGGLRWQIDNHNVQFVKDGGIAVFYGGLRGIIFCIKGTFKTTYNPKYFQIKGLT